MFNVENSNLKFREFNYDEVKKQLPEGYEPIPSLSAQVEIKRCIPICTHRFVSKIEAVSFIERYKLFFPYIELHVQKVMRNAVEYEYQVVAMKSTSYKGNKMPNVLYRTIDAENVEKLLKNGELLISTFKRCRESENDARRDKFELRNIVEIHEGTKVLEADMRVDDSLLVLCTSLPPVSPKTSVPDTIVITDPECFCREITNSLMEKGLCVAEVLYGACVYNDKTISIETDNFVSYICEKTDKDNMFPSKEIFEFVNAHAENDIIMNKPTSFMHENEFRFVWKLTKSFSDEKLIITNPNLVKYCKLMDAI